MLQDRYLEVMIYKMAILCYVFLYTGVALFFRSYILYKNTGINPFAKMGQGDIQGINERVLIFGALQVPLVALFYFLPNDLYNLLVPINYLEIDLLKNIGIGLMLVASVVAIIAQFQMGNSWRIGVNRNEKTELVSKGLFQYSRNPIYLALLISFIGFFLLAPNLPSFSCMLLSIPSLAIKIRIEEAYLLDKHGTHFQEYCKKVRRWI